MGFKWSRYGLAENPVGAQVMFDYLGRRLLGDVRAVVHDVFGGTRLVVTHFNGEPWPVEPLAVLVKVLR